MLKDALSASNSTQHKLEQQKNPTAQYHCCELKYSSTRNLNVSRLFEFRQRKPTDQLKAKPLYLNSKRLSGIYGEILTVSGDESSGCE